MLPESSIKNAKEKRKRLREMGASTPDDFISLTVATRPDEPQGPHPESRLVREEDELGDGEDGPSFVIILVESLSSGLCSRLCGIHQRAGENRAREEGKKS